MCMSVESCGDFRNCLVKRYHTACAYREYSNKPVHFGKLISLYFSLFLLSQHHRL